MRSGRTTKAALLGATLSMLGIAGAFAGEVVSDGGGRATHQIPRTAQPITVDAVLDDPGWQEALVVALPYEVYPGENIPAPVETECRLTYDDKNFYLGCHALDPEPQKIRAHVADRDTAWKDDFLGIIVDTFNDERRAFEFFVNPLGVQMDLIRNDLANSRDQEDASWDAIWSSAGKLTDDGYVVEVAVPFTSLRFQHGAGEQTWGASLFRAYPRSARHEIYSHTYDRNRNCSLCQSDKLQGFVDVKPGRDLELDPTLTGSQVEEREELEDPELGEADQDAQVGLTARWGITPNMSLSGALNPDFSQVESDAARLSVNNQFALFFEEKRPFFLEGADLFQTFFRTVHTRVVADPAWGLKLAGKESRNAVGAFAVQDDVTNLLLPGSEGSELIDIEDETLAGVARYRRDVGETSAIGLVLTGRDGGDYSNFMGGFDGLIRFTDRDSIRAQILASSTEYPDEIIEEYGEDYSLRPGEMKDPAYLLEYEHDSRNWNGGAGYRSVGTDFRADLGFMPRVDYEQYYARLEHTWWGEEEDWYNWWELGGRYVDSQNQRGDLLVRQGEFWFNLSGPLQSFVRINPEFGERGYEGEVFDENILGVSFRMQPSGSVSLGLNSRSGQTVDYSNAQPADQVLLRPFLDLNLGRHLRLNFNHAYQQLEVDEGRLFTANLSELRGVYQFNIRTFFRAIVQYLDVDRDPTLYEDEVDARNRDLFGQLLFSYKVNPRTVFFLGYSEGLESTEDVDFTTMSRAVFMKVGYAWVK